MIDTNITITNIIILVTAGISILAFYWRELMQKWIFSPYLARYHKQYYRFITSGFLHANWVHLFINMLVFSMFGNYVEMTYSESLMFGSKSTYYYLMLYLGALIVANFPSFFKYQNDPSYQSLGASGAVSAVVFTFILMAPFEPIYLYGLIRLPAWVFGIAYMVYEYIAGKRKVDNVGHDAHIMGAIYGILFNILMKPSLVTDLVDQITNRLHM